MNAAGIEAFLAIMQVHSLNKAAERLNVTQATVSYRLKMLEEEMGGTLIARSKGTHTIELTPFGENFAVIAERWRILKQDTEVLQAVGPQLRLTIGGSNSLNTYVLPPLYTALMQHGHPRQFSVQFGNNLAYCLCCPCRRRNNITGRGTSASPILHDL